MLASKQGEDFADFISANQEFLKEDGKAKAAATAKAAEAKAVAEAKTAAEAAVEAKPLLRKSRRSKSR